MKSLSAKSVLIALFFFSMGGCNGDPFKDTSKSGNSVNSLGNTLADGTGGANGSNNNPIPAPTPSLTPSPTVNTDPSALQGVWTSSYCDKKNRRIKLPAQ